MEVIHMEPIKPLRNYISKTKGKDLLTILDLTWLKSKDVHPQQYKHYCTVETNISKIITKLDISKQFDDEDYFFLSAAACLHDLGKKLEGTENYDSKKHGEYFVKKFSKEYGNFGFNDSHVRTLETIVEYHSTGDLTLFNKYPDTYSIPIKKLATLFKLADTLDTTSERDSKLST